MTDRDHFAAAALTGLLTQSAYYSDAAIKAYEHADRMLRERERTAWVAQPEVQPICDRPVAGSTPAAGCGVTSSVVNMRDWVLGQGEFSPESVAEAYRRTAEGLARKVAARMEQAVADAFSTSTDLDAEPAAIAEPSEWGTRREGQGAGNTQEPVAYAVFCGDSRYPYNTYDDHCEAEAIAKMLSSDDRGDGEWVVVPLYRTPEEHRPGPAADGIGWPTSGPGSMPHAVTEPMPKTKPASVSEQAAVAWAVTDASGQDVYEAFAGHQMAEAILLATQLLFGKTGPLPLRPLYFAATLTDEEREAIEEAIRLGGQWGWSETLRGLLERLA